MSLKQTPLHDYFVNTGCRMAPFAGWEMPIQFSGLINEHTAVREKAGLFDISHMGVFLLEGIGCKDALQNLVPTDLYRIGAGEACYTLLLNENGGIIDDLIIYDLGNNKNTEKILLIINAACTESDIRWIQKNCSKEKISISDFKKNNVLGALQGPKALEILERTFQESLKNIPRFGHKIIRVKTKNLETQNPIFVARTGYTGEDGFEFLLEASLAPKIWAALVKEGVTLCGLGARDTLRLEAAMHLYGHEMTELTTPFDAGLGWLVNLEMTRNFVGREVLEKQMATGGLKKLIGLKIHGKGIARQGYKIFDSKKEIGEITSGSWSPTLNEAIALGYIDKEFGKVGTKIKVDIRGKMHDATIVKRPFYKRKSDF